MTAEATVSTFPTLHIYVPEDPFVDRELWQDGTIALTDAPEEIAFETIDARIRGRGNSTWWSGENKRPLRFRLGEPRSMFGSEYEARDWILLADNFDRSLFRNYSALYFARSLGSMVFVPTAHRVHLYVNGEYMGLYLLTDERDVNLGRLELVWDADPSLSGFFLEMDGRAPQTGVEGEDFVMVNGVPYDLRWPSSDEEMTERHIDYVQAYLEAVSLAVRSQDFAEIEKLIDIETFVDFYLVQELYKDTDAWITSVFMHIDGVGEERRLYMGPVWDFDLAAGNRSGQILGHGPENLYVAVLHYWYRYLLDVPEFREIVVARWDEIRDVQIVWTIARIQETALRYEAEFARNFARHPLREIPQDIPPPELLAIDDFMGQVAYLVDWLEARTAWLDDYFHGRLEDYDPLWELVRFYTYEAPIHVRRNGEQQALRVAPINLQNRVLLTLADLAALFDLTVTYDLELGIAILERDSIVISHGIGTSFFTVGAEPVSGAPFSIVIRDQVFLSPLVIAEALGYEIAWDADDNTLVITGAADPYDVYEEETAE